MGFTSLPPQQWPSSSPVARQKIGLATEQCSRTSLDAGLAQQHVRAFESEGAFEREGGEEEDKELTRKGSLTMSSITSFFKAWMPLLSRANPASSSSYGENEPLHKSAHGVYLKQPLPGISARSMDPGRGVHCTKTNLAESPPNHGNGVLQQQQAKHGGMKGQEQPEEQRSADTSSQQQQQVQVLAVAGGAARAPSPAGGLKELSLTHGSTFVTPENSFTTHSVSFALPQPASPKHLASPQQSPKVMQAQSLSSSSPLQETSSPRASPNATPLYSSGLLGPGGPDSPTVSRALAVSGAIEATGQSSRLLAVSPSLPPRMQRKEWYLKDYAILEKLYTGYASTVYKAFCKFSGELVCIKAYNLTNLCELNKHQIFREVKLHNR